MSEWIQCPNCGTVMTITTSGYLCPMCGTVLPVKILHMTSGTSFKVDAVPVIRCKDCKHRPIGGQAHLHNLVFPDEACPCNCVDDPWYSWMPRDEWFCANGARMDAEREEE